VRHVSHEISAPFVSYEPATSPGKCTLIERVLSIEAARCLSRTAVPPKFPLLNDRPPRGVMTSLATFFAGAAALAAKPWLLDRGCTRRKGALGRWVWHGLESMEQYERLADCNKRAKYY
jgi:hypothetical protein